MHTPHLIEVLLLLGGAVGAVLLFQRLRIPPVLAYLFIGLVLGPHVAGVVVDATTIRAVAEFGIVFLLFTIGLSFSWPQIQAARGLVFGLGGAQVLLTVVLIGIGGWLLGLPAAAAFVAGAAFAQSSTAIITRQLMEQGEEHSRHGRLATAMSVFQDVTTVPFVVIIPVLGAVTMGSAAVAGSLGLAIAKALAAFAIVFFAGRLVLRPFFQAVASSRSAELFTLTVLFVSLAAAATAGSLGVSLAFGAFLAGMVLGETEFRHQVEATIRPFRDVLLGLFFVGIGLKIDLAILSSIWHLAVAGGLALLGVKILIVAAISAAAGLGAVTAWRCGLLLAVGGEFGFALVAIGLDADTIGSRAGQIVLGSILLSMLTAPFLIRYNESLAARLPGSDSVKADPVHDLPRVGDAASMRNHVILCGYGRIGQAVAAMLEREGVPFTALDLDPSRVRDAHLAGKAVFYGDSADPAVLQAVGLEEARLLVVSYDDVPSTRRILGYVVHAGLDLPVMVRTRDETHRDALLEAGASDVVAETLEAGMMIGIRALQLLAVPPERLARHLADHPHGRYEALREHFQGDARSGRWEGDPTAVVTRPLVVGPDTPYLTRALNEIELGDVQILSLVRNGARIDDPEPEIRLNKGDVLVLRGSRDAIERLERHLAL